jgi:hypothetical protein
MTTPKLSGSTKPGFKYHIPITPVKQELPKCYGHRCDFSGGYCIGCTVYCGCAVQTKQYLYLIENCDWPEVSP